jgi:hypothetical protein
MTNFFKTATLHYLWGDQNSARSRRPPKGTFLELFREDDVLAQRILDFLRMQNQQNPHSRGMRLSGLAYCVVDKFLTTPLQALQSSDSSVQPAEPTTGDKAQNILKALSTRWVDSGCVSVGSTRVAVDPSYLPTQKILEELLEIVGNSMKK